MDYWLFKIMGEAGEEQGKPWASRAFLPVDFSLNPDYDWYSYEKRMYDIGNDYQLEDVVLSEGATEVDFVFGSIELGGQGMILSEKALDIILKFNLPSYECFDLNVVNDIGERLNRKYKWLHILVEDDSGLIDFDLSEVFVNGRRVTNHSCFQNVKFDDNVEFQLVCLENKDQKDILEIKKFPHGPIISDRLKKAIELNLLSGLYPFRKLHNVRDSSSS